MKNIITLLLVISSISFSQDFWEPTNGPFGGSINSIAISSNGHIFAGTDDGVFRSTDNGENWTHLNGLTNLEVWSFTINSNGYIFAGTDDGVFRSINSTTSVEDEYNVPTTYSLEQNYPNPFNPNTKIRYSIPQSSKVVIKVFDILGNEIEALVNEEKQTGTYEITWYAEGLPSGIYFYRIQANNFIETKKMMLMK